MALVRILIDGYSLLHSWTEVAAGKPRYSAAARDELVRRLTLYRDAVSTPITVFFDGKTGLGSGSVQSTAELEILYSRTGQTADELIERTAHRLTPYGEVLVVTDDGAERETVLSMGGMASSCHVFIQNVEAALKDMEREIKHSNRRERNEFKRSR